MKYRNKQWFESMFSAAAHGEDRWGHQWRGIQKHRYCLTLSLIKELLRAQDSQRILDLGCGLGDFTNMVYRENTTNALFGVDFVDSAIAAAQRRYPSIGFAQAELPTIPVEGPFDGIIALECLNYLEPCSLSQALQNISARLKPTGWFLYSGHLPSGVGDARYLSGEQAIAAMNAVGLHAVGLKYNYALLYTKCESPLLYTVDLCDRLEARLKDWSRSPTRIGKAATRRLVSAVVAMTCIVRWICKRTVLRSLSLAKVMHTLTRVMLPRRGRSHAIILFRPLSGARMPAGEGVIGVR